MSENTPANAVTARDGKGFCQQQMTGVAHKFEIVGTIDPKRHTQSDVYGGGV